MKKLSLYLIQLFFFAIISNPSYLLSQENWVVHSKVIPVEEYQGLNFKYSALVRTEIVDDSAAAYLFTRIDTRNGMGFFDNMYNRPIRNKQWRKYEIQGVIDSTANKILFGTMCFFNGNFYYDNFKLEVETIKNNWETIFYRDFEGDSANVNKSIKDWWSNNELYITDIYKEQNGNQCMVVDGRGIPNFGMNKEAGRYAEVNGIELYYEIYGEGQPLVVLHGNGGSIADFSMHYPYFIENNYKVIAIDSRAQGRSGDSEEELTYMLMASDVNALLDKLNLDSVYIWGHSDGAIIGLILAFYYYS